MFKLHYYLICLTLLFHFIICDLELCNPNSLYSDRKFGISPEAFLHNNWKLYDCELFKDDRIIGCKVDRPILKDDYVAFAVKKGKNGKCNTDVCTKGRRETILWRHDRNGVVRANELEFTANGRKCSEYHICERFTYNGNTCDVNYQLVAYEYERNADVSLAKWISQIAKILLQQL